jgi:IS605 OrfB family transposase
MLRGWDFMKLQKNTKDQYTRAFTFAVKNIKPHQALLIDRILIAFQDLYLCAIDELEEIINITGKLPNEMAFMKNYLLHRNITTSHKYIDDLNLVQKDATKDPYKKLLTNVNRINKYSREKYFKLVVDEVKSELCEDYSKQQYNDLLNKKILLAILNTHRKSSGLHKYYKNIMFNYNEYVILSDDDGKINSIKSSFGLKIKDPMLKLGTLKIFRNREALVGTPKRLIIKRSELGKYSITITFNVPKDELQYRFNEASGEVGIDWGLKNLMSLSDGTFINKYDEDTKKELERLVAYKKKLNTQLTNKQQFLATVNNDKKVIPTSNNYNRTLQKLRSVEEKIARIREFHNHRISNDLLSKYETLCVEDINTAEIKEKKEGKLNKYIRTGMNRNINDASWGDIKTKLEYKSKWYGNKFVLVPARGTTQTCNNCGNVPEVRVELNVRTYKCENCGHEMDRDLNAALNILKSGKAILGI